MGEELKRRELSAPYEYKSDTLSYGSKKWERVESEVAKGLQNARYFLWG